MRRVVLFAGCALLALAPSSAEAQRRCVKGIPCGNSCIAANRTCHKDPPPTARPAPSPRDTARPPAPSDTARGRSGPVAVGPWVASSRGATYYKAGCSGARKLAAGNRIYFKTESDAAAAGYRRSRQSGC